MVKKKWPEFLKQKKLFHQMIFSNKVFSKNEYTNKIICFIVKLQPDICNMIGRKCGGF